MKAEFNQLSKLIEKLELKHEKMDETFWDRSEKWQESDKGVEHEDKMNDLESIIGDLNMAKDELEELI